MPQSRNVHEIFEEFVASLSTLIKEKVSEAVACATSEFLNSKFGAGPATAEEPKPVRRRRRRRGKPAVEAVAKPVKVTRKRRRRGAAKAAGQTVTLSKNGKRIGRPPKAAVEAKPAE